MEEHTTEVEASAMTETVSSSVVPKIHPACAAYPEMDRGEFAELKSNIRDRGQILPCELYGEYLLDGRHRWRACRELMLNVKVERFYGTEEEAIARVASLNGKRRNLSAGQKAAAAAALEPLFAAALAKSKAEKCSSAGESGGRGNTSTKAERVDQIVEQPTSRPKHERAAVLAAKATGANPSYVADVKKLQQTHPELVDEIKAGKKTVPEAKRAAAEPTRIEQLKPKRKSSPVNEKPTQDETTLFGARVAWSAINKLRRKTFVAAYKRVPVGMREAFWVWAEQMTEDGE